MLKPIHNSIIIPQKTAISTAYMCR